MTETVYTIHRADNDEIVGRAGADTIRATAANIARSLATAAPRMEAFAYVHNGLGVIAAGRCDSAGWHDLDRHPYRDRHLTAMDERRACGIPND